MHSIRIAAGSVFDQGVEFAGNSVQSFANALQTAAAPAMDNQLFPRRFARFRATHDEVTRTGECAGQ